MKKIYTKTHDDPNIFEEVYQSINTHFYFGVVHYIFVLNIIKNFENSIKLNYDEPKNKNWKLDYLDCFIFKRIKKGEESINLILNKELSNKELSKFNNFLLKNHYEKYKLLLPLQILNIDIPIEILSKFYVYFYTHSTTFFVELNNNLMKNNYNDYSIFIKIMYKALEKGVFITNVNCFLYKPTNISEKEFNIFIECFKKKQENFPSSILYSTAFLSFTKDINVAKYYLRS